MFRRRRGPSSGEVLRYIDMAPGGSVLKRPKIDLKGTPLKVLRGLSCGLSSKSINMQKYYAGKYELIK